MKLARDVAVKVLGRGVLSRFTSDITYDNFPIWSLEEPTISPDGRYLVYSRKSGGSSLWVLKLGNTQKPTQER